MRPRHTSRARQTAQMLCGIGLPIFLTVAFIPSVRPAAGATTRARWEHPMERSLAPESASSQTREPAAASAAPLSIRRPGTRTRRAAWKPFPRLIERIQTRDRVVFITIDDGWFRDWRVVKLLRRERFPMTIYLTEAASRGHRARFYRALRSAGATLQNHTLTHPNLARTGPAGTRRQVCGASYRLSRRLGSRPTSFRPPYGEWTPAAFRAARRCGMTSVVMWNAEITSGRLLGTLEAGSIVLLHFRPELREDLEALRRHLRRLKLRPATLEDYLPGGAKA